MSKQDILILREQEALLPDGDYGADYFLRDDALNCWIAVGTLAVSISRHADGILIDVVPRHCALENLLTQWVMFDEAECPEESE